MRLSRPAKRCLATLAAVVMVLCQTISLAHACAAGVSQAGDAVAMLCHDSGGEAESGKSGTAGHSCQYVSATADSKQYVMAATDLPVIVIRFDAGTPQQLPNYMVPALLRIEPPPHSILHCCLRN